MTQVGVILGTAGYMSPEQANGRTADKRSDVWAFGCVLYEMLTGAAAFGGGDDTVSEVLAAVLKSEPDWSALPASTPIAVETLLRRCLTKDPRERLHDIADARLEIRDVGKRSGEGAPMSARTNRLAWTLAATFGVVALVLGCSARSVAARPSAPTAVYRSLILPPVGDVNAAASESRTGVPRARRRSWPCPLARWRASGARRAGARWPSRLVGSSARQCERAPARRHRGASNPFWSADGRHIAFIAEGKLKRVDASGGPVLTLSDRARNFSTGTWSRDNVILFVAADGSILRMSATAGDASPATPRDASREGAHTSPFFLPDGRRFLYAVGAEDRTSGGVYVGSLDSSERVKLIDNALLPAYASGFVLFVRDDTLMAQRFDAGRLALDGEPMAVAEQLRVAGAPGTSGVYAVSQSGVLVYQEGLIQKSALVWLDRGGRELGTLSEPRGFSYLQLSPNQRHLAVSVYDDATRTRDVYLFDTARGGQTRLTSEPSDDFSPVWAPHGDRLAFAGRRQGDQALNLYTTNVSGTGGEKRLLDLDGVEIPTSWSPDERFLLFQTPSPGADIKVLSLADGQVSSLVSTRFTEGSAQFSPDGRWVAYSSNETGRTEVYVLPFQRAGPRSADLDRRRRVAAMAARRKGTVLRPRRQHADGSRRQSERSVRGRRSGQPAVPVAVSFGEFPIRRHIGWTFPGQPLGRRRDTVRNHTRRQLAGYAAEGMTFRVTGLVRHQPGRSGATSPEAAPSNLPEQRLRPLQQPQRGYNTRSLWTFRPAGPHEGRRGLGVIGTDY